ncbi:MAG: DUF6714 family protein [Bacteroidota bacterium]
MPLTDLEQQIYDAFIGVPFPADGYDIYAAQTDDDYGSPTFTTDHFPSRLWYEVTPAQMHDCYAAFSFLHPDGWQYYLPALLWMEIRQQNGNFQTIWILGQRVGEFQAWQELRHSKLNLAQTEAVVSFLEYYINRERNVHATHAHYRYAQGGIEWAEEMEPAMLDDAEAALSYWKDRLESK